jgi:hypothetical protein
MKHDSVEFNSSIRFIEQAGKNIEKTLSLLDQNIKTH